MAQISDAVCSSKSAQEVAIIQASQFTTLNIQDDYDQPELRFGKLA